MGGIPPSVGQKNIQTSMPGASSEHAVRGWKASEIAEQSLLRRGKHGMVLQTNQPLLDTVAVVLLVGILIGLGGFLVTRRRKVKHVYVEEKNIIIQKGIENKDEQCCSCSSSEAPHDDTSLAVVCNSSTKKAVVLDTIPEGDGNVISKRVEEATATLSSIHSRLPESMSRKDKVAMTHMMLEAIKVNEACKTTASMERMESITEKGVEIQSGTFDMKKRQYRSNQVTQHAQYIAKMVMDIMCTGVLIMILSGGSTAWYQGIIYKKTQACVALSSSSSHTSFFYGRMMIQTVSCHVLHLLRALQAVVILVITPISIHKIGIYTKVDDVPIFTLGATFSGICGLSGTYVVKWLGGRGMLWLVMWQVWVTACILCLVLSSRISRYDLGLHVHSKGEVLNDDIKTLRQSGILVIMWILLGVLYPMMMGLVVLYR